jgi:hypothetical protein
LPVRLVRRDESTGALAPCTDSFPLWLSGNRGIYAGVIRTNGWSVYEGHLPRGKVAVGGIQLEQVVVGNDWLVRRLPVTRHLEAEAETPHASRVVRVDGAVDVCGGPSAVRVRDFARGTFATLRIAPATSVRLCRAIGFWIAKLRFAVVKIRFLPAEIHIDRQECAVRAGGIGGTDESAIGSRRSDLSYRR